MKKLLTNAVMVPVAAFSLAHGAENASIADTTYIDWHGDVKIGELIEQNGFEFNPGHFWETALAGDGNFVMKGVTYTDVRGSEETQRIYGSGDQEGYFTRDLNHGIGDVVLNTPQGIYFLDDITDIRENTERVDQLTEDLDEAEAGRDFYQERHGITKGKLDRCRTLRERGIERENRLSERADSLETSIEDKGLIYGLLPNQINVWNGADQVYGVSKDWYAGNLVYGVGSFGRFDGLEEGVDRTLLDVAEIQGIGRRETVDRTEWEETPSFGLLGKVGYKNKGFTLYAGPGVVRMRKNTATSRGLEHYEVDGSYRGSSFDPATAGSESELGLVYWAGIDFDLGKKWSLGLNYISDGDEFDSVGINFGWDMK